MKRVLVTGAGGFVGARILDMWRGKFALCAFPSDTLRTADENAVLRFILKEHPDVIVHTAASLVPVLLICHIRFLLSVKPFCFLGL